MSKSDRWFFTTVYVTLTLQVIHLVLRFLYIRDHGVAYSGPDFGLLINLGMMITLVAGLLIYRKDRR